MNRILLSMMFLLMLTSNVFSQTKISFEKQNAGNKYKNFSFGMGISYSNNTSLVNFVKQDFPNYNPNSTAGNIKSLDAGVEFFGSSEFQISRLWSVKAEYSYFTKSISLPAGTFYTYSYNAHQPLLNLSYISRSQFIFFKFGAGVGYDFSTFTRSVSNFDAKYTASGFIIKPEISANAQLSNKVAGYISGFMDFKFTGDLKDDAGANLLTPSGETVNLNSQGLGLRLGLSIYIF